MQYRWWRHKGEPDECCPHPHRPLGTSLVVQWLRLCTINAEGLGSIPGWGTKMPHAVWHSQKQTDPQTHPQNKTTTTKRTHRASYLCDRPVRRIKGPHWSSFIQTIASLLPKNFILNSRPHGRAPLLCKAPISHLWGMETASHFHTCSENSTEYVRIWETLNTGLTIILPGLFKQFRIDESSTLKWSIHPFY